jgi:hypothetical protein
MFWFVTWLLSKKVSNKTKRDKKGGAEDDPEYEKVKTVVYSTRLHTCDMYAVC